MKTLLLKRTALCAAILIMLLTAFTLSAKGYSVSQLPNPQRDAVPTWVSNPDGVLSPAAVAALNSRLENLHVTSKVPMMVVAVNDLPEHTDIDRYATDIFSTWGIGDKKTNNGVLLVLALNDRRYAIRTGRGIVTQYLPDVETARIARDALVPALKDGDPDRAVTATVDRVRSILTDPEVAADIKENGEKFLEEPTILDIIIVYLWCAVGLTVLILLWVLFNVRSTRGEERHQRYVTLYPMVRMIFALSWLGAGIPFVVYFPFRNWVRHLREGRHLCPNCSAEMGRVDEEHDNDFLTPAQDMEEKLDSVDYDVWLCPDCGETDIYPFVNRDVTLSECEQCHARTSRFVRDRILTQPTTRSEGHGVHEYACMNCGHVTRRPFTLAKLATAVPFIIGGGGGGRGPGSFGGFGGGGLGGGMTGGGGTSGGW
ncbi:MAG: TPM domain-containing protein [Muribaculaceae bacterium]|nr:TPM domain-containing protein [Muribaculaceae bacterium]